MNKSPREQLARKFSIPYLTRSLANPDLNPITRRLIAKSRFLNLIEYQFKNFTTQKNLLFFLDEMLIQRKDRWDLELLIRLRACITAPEKIRLQLEIKDLPLDPNRLLMIIFIEAWYDLNQSHATFIAMGNDPIPENLFGRQAERSLEDLALEAAWIRIKEIRGKDS